jgi:hypothetical protein
MKKSFMYLAVVLLAAMVAGAQDTGGDKATAGRTQPKTTAHKKGTKGTSKNAAATKPDFADGSVRSTGGSNIKSNPQPPDPLLKTTTHKKSHKRVKKSTAPDDWAGTGSGSGTSKKKKTSNDDWEVTTAAKRKRGGTGTRSGKNSTDLNNASGTQERPGVPPPTRPTDPK